MVSINRPLIERTKQFIRKSSRTYRTVMADLAEKETPMDGKYYAFKNGELVEIIFPNPQLMVSIQAILNDPLIAVDNSDLNNPKIGSTQRLLDAVANIERFASMTGSISTRVTELRNTIAQIQQDIVDLQIRVTNLGG